MADESTEILMTSAGGFFPILMGFAASSGSDPDRIVLVNPLTRRMVVLEGDSASISEMLADGGGVGRGGAPPASKKSIQAMESVESAEDGSECPVCLDELKKGEEGGLVKEMPCRHRFHGGCIEKWLRMHGSCPVCRYRMPEEEETADSSKDQEDVAAAAAAESAEGRRGVQVTIVIQRRTTTPPDDLD